MVNTDDEQNWAYLLAPTFQCVNTSGKPLTEGYINVYIHGTRDKYYCAKDFDGTLHPFNIPLDSLGANIVLAQPLYTFDIYVYNKYGSLQMSRYNVKPHTDVGEAIAQLVEISSSDNTVGIDRTSATGWNLSIKDTVDRVDVIEEALDGFKTKQEEYSQSGGVTKTITNITQDENGEINVTYEDIDLPPEVPTVEITSPNDTIQISSSTDPETNVKTFEIDVKNSGMEYFTGNYGRSRYETRTPTVDKPYMDFIPCYVDSWSGYDYKGDFIINDWQAENSCWFMLKPGLYYINAIIQFEMTDGSLLNQEGWYECARGSGDYNETNDYFYHDWSNNSNIYDVDNRNFNTVHISYVKNVTAANGRNGIEFCPKLPYGISYVCIREVQIVKLDSAIAANGTEYVEGQGIKILNDVISVREGAGLKFSGNDLMVNTGSGINIVDDKLVVNAGTGINIVDNKVVINESYLTQLIDNQFITEISNIPGSGLSVDEDNKLNVNIGTGLALDEFNRIYVTGGGQAQVNAGSGLSIDENDYLNVNVGSGLSIDENNKINVNVGSGLQIVNGDIITINPEVGDVVETVEKLKKDLDTQITTNFDMPNISQVYDFANATNWITANGACMLYQAFTIPINHDIRTISEDPDMPTLFGIYAQQSFDYKIMLALYEYQYAGTGEEAGSSTYVGDTGPVTVLQGVNEYPLKNRNPSISELRSDRVYYASLYLPSDAFANGLFLAGCPGYGTQSVPAIPRLSCATENITWQNVELDMDDPTTTLNHYQVIQIPGQDPYYQYYIGPWVGGYNERWSTPRFYMQIRNGEYNEPVIPTEPFIDLGDDKLPRGGISVANLPGFNSSSANSGFRDVTPLINVTITSYEWIDNMATAGGWEAGNCVFNSDYSTNMSGVSNTVTNLGEVFRNESYVAYAHRITFTTPITLTANVTYRFLCSSWSSSSNWIWSWADPTDVFDAGNNGWYVDWNSNVLRYAHQAGQYLKLYDSNNNSYVI